MVVAVVMTVGHTVPRWTMQVHLVAILGHRNPPPYISVGSSQGVPRGLHGGSTGVPTRFQGGSSGVPGGSEGFRGGSTGVPWGVHF